MAFTLNSWNWQEAPIFNGFQGPNPINPGVTRVILAKDANFPSPLILNQHPDAAVLLSQYINEPDNFLTQNIGRHHPTICDPWAIPMLRSGRKYHKTFHKMLQYAVGPQHNGQDITNLAQTISFLELLKFPTSGNSGRNPRFIRYVSGDFGEMQFGEEDVESFNARQQHGWTRVAQIEHLRLIDKILGNPDKKVFVFSGFSGLFQAFNNDQHLTLSNESPLLVSLANWLRTDPVGHRQPPAGIHAQIVPHTHFSNAISNADLQHLSQHFNPVG